MDRTYVYTSIRMSQNFMMDYINENTDNIQHIDGAHRTVILKSGKRVSFRGRAEVDKLKGTHSEVIYYGED